ncbi:MAG: pyruvate, phosphate dikinase, partial [Alphaproteobacteria bacterium]
NPRFAYDSYRRFIQMFSDVVLNVEHHTFEAKLDELKKEKGFKDDVDLTAKDWEKVVIEYKKIVQKTLGKSFPQKPKEQLLLAVKAVFKSWNIPRAKTYRQIHKIPHNFGTAVNIQAMVFGNMGETSGTGVAFTRNPSTGEKKFYGEFLMNAQGEDVVAGIRTPKPIAGLKEVMPEAYAELEKIYQKLENHFCDMQDLEFTIEEGKLYLLQTRNGKRTAAAAVRIAVEMVQEEMISKEEAVASVEANSLDTLLHPCLDPNEAKKVIAKGLPASPGAACGKVVFHADTAKEMADKGEKVVLVRKETSPEDIHGMHAAQGILTSCGGMTSHAAVVARGMGTPCVAGVTEVIINPKAKKFTVGEIVVNEGDVITLDGTEGTVILGECKTVEAVLSKEFETILKWADEIRTLQVRTNADSPEDAKRAIEFGAEGIGLCRTEHMFFNEERIRCMREMILSNTEKERIKAVDKLLPFQKQDFKEIFKIMKGLPVTIRLLDPPLHEFLPEKNKDVQELAQDFGLTFEQVKDRAENLQEVNPMLGHRGCRLAITYPEILYMQTQAILEAACEVQKEGIKVQPEIMIPLVGTRNEFTILKEKIEKIANKVLTESVLNLKYKIGTMLEIPRACAVANRIAKHAEFFSFGTNDLTQLTFGYSRDDVARFVPYYKEHGVLEEDPFETLDQRGVGEMIKMGVKRGRSVKKDLKVGICGEHGGDPDSIDFFHREGFNYVSCSPFRVPVARLAAAQAVIRNKK